MPTLLCNNSNNIHVAAYVELKLEAMLETMTIRRHQSGKCKASASDMNNEQFLVSRNIHQQTRGHRGNFEPEWP